MQVHAKLAGDTPTKVEYDTLTALEAVKRFWNDNPDAIMAVANDGEVSVYTKHKDGVRYTDILSDGGKIHLEKRDGDVRMGGLRLV